MNQDSSNSNRFVADRTDGGDHLSVHISNSGQAHDFTSSNRDESDQLFLDNLNSPSNRTP